MKKAAVHLAMYAGTILISALLLFLILKYGPTSPIPTIISESSWTQTVYADLMHNLNLPITGLLLQILIVLVACRVCAKVFRYFGQTRVIGEIVAGIILGKSVFALIWPEGFEFIFPDSSMPRLYFLSQIGLILFMFVVGLELNLKTVRKHTGAAIMISHASILFPFLLGAGFSVFIYNQYAPEGVAFSSFALFMGIAMSITAFPVLARIIKEKNLTNTPLGDMALTCAAVDDVTAWFVLAAIVGIVKAGSAASALVVIAMSAAYIAFMLYMVRPSIEKRLQPRVDGTFKTEHFALVFTVVLASALVAEFIGIHALFGAFLAGTVMPKSLSFRADLIQRVEDVSSVALLPLFFAFTGIRTQIGLLSSLSDWLICGAIILLAILGKLVGSAVAARWSGQSWPEALSVGVLMNTRGLMELVVLNIGYDLGLLSPQIFSMMVIMALVTTMMTGPLLDLLLSKKNRS